MNQLHSKFWNIEKNELGNGQYRHADDGTGLVEIFETMANNPPTILTE